MKTCFCHLTVVWRPLAEERIAISTQSIHRWKVHLVGLQFRRWQYGTIFIRLVVIASETREMLRNSKRIWPYSSSRSSTVIDLARWPYNLYCVGADVKPCSINQSIIDLGVNGKPICDFLLIVTVAVSATVRDIHAYKDRKLLILPIPPLFDASAWGDPWNFRM